MNSDRDKLQSKLAALMAEYRMKESVFAANNHCTSAKRGLLEEDNLLRHIKETCQDLVQHHGRDPEILPTVLAAADLILDLNKAGYKQRWSPPAVGLIHNLLHHKPGLELEEALLQRLPAALTALMQIGKTQKLDDIMLAYEWTHAIHRQARTLPAITPIIQNFIASLEPAERQYFRLEI